MNIKYLCMLIILCMQNQLHDSCKFKIFITQNVSYVGNILLKGKYGNRISYSRSRVSYHIFNT